MRIALIFSILVAITVVAAATPRAHAAEPPACRPVPVPLDVALRQLREWPGFRPARGLAIVDARLAPCLSTNDTARLLAMLKRQHAGVSWFGEIVVSLDSSTGKPLDGKPQRGQIARVTKALRRLPAAMLKDPMVRVLTKAYGPAERGVLDDEGGHGAACIELMTPAKAPRGDVSVTWCAGKNKGVTRMTVHALADVKGALWTRVGDAVEAEKSGCALGRAHLSRFVVDGKKRWRVHGELIGSDKAGCGGRWRGVVAF